MAIQIKAMHFDLPRRLSTIYCNMLVYSDWLICKLGYTVHSEHAVGAVKLTCNKCYNVNNDFSMIGTYSTSKYIGIPIS